MDKLRRTLGGQEEEQDIITDVIMYYFIRSLG